MIKLKFVKEVHSDGQRFYRLTACSGRGVDLPAVYTKMYPHCYVYNSYFTVYRNKDAHINVSINGLAIPENEFDELLSVLRQCAVNLATAERELAQARAEWQGEVEVVIKM